jgi:peptide/nickel transport system substrate-binding protein
MAALPIALAGCSGQGATATVRQSPVTLTMAFGLSSGQNPQFGARQAVTIIASETLVAFGRDGRPQSRLAESWTLSEDAKTLKITLRSGAVFHDGQPVTASILEAVLKKQLRNRLGTAFEDIKEIRVASPREIEFKLNRPSRFILEALADIPIEAGELPGKTPNGTGPFKVIQLSDGGAEMVANDAYYAGRPSIDRIQIKPYASVRAAWADMLRGQADMLYEVGPDAIEILQPSKAVRVISHLRNYQYMGILNVRQPKLKDPGFRRALNAAIDRQSLVSDVLKGHALPADSAVWPSNWAYDSTAPVFKHEPREVGGTRTTLSCLLGEVALERFALALQQQLQRVGVDLRCELMSLDDVSERLSKGNFDVFLADFQMGPSLFQTYRNWGTGASRNMGGYSSTKVDAAFDQINASANDDEYRAGVAALQRAIYEDPPAIFIAWSERARAVSTRFDVPIEPGRDILGTLRQWKQVPEHVLSTQN